MITAMKEGQLFVEGNAAEISGSAKASLRLTGTTRIFRRRVAARVTDLKVGQRVHVWVTGPVMESYPLQAEAAVIVIDS